jgi:hypothetical protein
MGVVRAGDAAKICQRSEKTIRAAIRAGDLPAVEGAWNGGRKGEPGRVQWVDLEDLRRWHTSRGGQAWRGEMAPPDSLEALAVEVRRLRERLDRLDRSERPAPPAPVVAAPAQAAPRPPAPTVRRRKASPASNLPDGLVSLREEGRLHGGGDRSYNAWVHNAALGVISGKWPGATPRAHPVTRALSPEGRRRFHDWYGGWDGAHLPAAWWRDRPDVCELCRAHDATSPTEMVAVQMSGSPQSP